MGFLFSGPSALFGQPALSAQDELIVKYYFLGFFPANVPVSMWPDPKNGLPGVPQLPAEHLYDHQDRRGVAGAAIFGIVFLCIALVSRLSLRFWLKQLTWGWDDAAFILAVALGIPSLYMGWWYAVPGGFGKHIQAMSYVQAVNQNVITPLMEMTFYSSLAMVRASVVIWFRRVIGVSSRRWQIFTNLLLAVIIIYAIVSFILWIPAYGGVRAYWATYHVSWCVENMVRWNPNGYIMPIFVLAVWGAVLDVILVIVPFVLFLQTNLPPSKRIRLSLLTCVGIATTATSIKRCVIARKMNLTKEIDAMWPGQELNVYDVVETMLTFVVGCMPMFNSIGVALWRKISGQDSEADSKPYSDKTRSTSDSETLRKVETGRESV